MSNSQEQKEVLFPNGKEIDLSAGKFSVKPFVMKERDVLIDLITGLLDEISNIEDLKKGINTGTSLKRLLNSSKDLLVCLYVKVLGKDKDWIENNITIGDEMLIIGAVMDVNEIPLLLTQIQELLLGKKAQ